MKFLISTTDRTVTLLEPMTMLQLEELKKFIGNDWQSWSLHAEPSRETLKIVETEKWIPYPYQPYQPYQPYIPTYPNPLQPTIWYGTEFPSQLLFKSDTFTGLPNFSVISNQSSKPIQ